MAVGLEDLRVLQVAEGVADGLWEVVVNWEPFAKKVVGEQIARAADSIGANIAEAYGRYHYGEKLRFLYYARGSLFETKYWLNRAGKRKLMPPAQKEDYAKRLTDLARQLNAFAASLNAQRRKAAAKPKPNLVSEPASSYDVSEWPGSQEPLFTENHLAWLQKE